MSCYPIEIKRQGESGLEIAWSDGQNNSISSRVLRKNCPCATCGELRGESSHASPLGGTTSLLKVIEHSSEEELRLGRVWPVGNYAIGIEWGDGHKTGIYTFTHLAQLTEANTSDSKP